VVIQRAVVLLCGMPIYYERRISKLSLNAAELPKFDAEVEEISPLQVLAPGPQPLLASTSPRETFLFSVWISAFNISVLSKSVASSRFSAFQIFAFCFVRIPRFPGSVVRGQ
jgi:hypothetical protein